MCVSWVPDTGVPLVNVEGVVRVEPDDNAAVGGRVRGGMSLAAARSGLSGMSVTSPASMALSNCRSTNGDIGGEGRVKLIMVPTGSLRVSARWCTMRDSLVDAHLVLVLTLSTT